MKTKWVVVGLVALVVVAAAAGAGQLSAMRNQASGPETTVNSFYAWYLGYIGRDGEPFRNPLVDGAYRDCGFLTPGFVQRVDELLANPGQGGYDPFLLAQDIPSSVAVESVDVAGQTASVVASTSFAHHRLHISLVQAGGQWLIDAIRPVAAQ